MTYKVAYISNKQRACGQLAGLGLIITGVVVQTKFNNYFAFLGGEFSGAAILLIVVGSIIFIIGFFGCCGAYKENYCMTMTFAVLLAIIFVLEIAAGITAYAMRAQTRAFISKKLYSSLNEFGPDHPGITHSWNQAQTDFECCGVANYTDWTNSAANISKNSLPDSCCREFQDGCGKNMAAHYNSTVMWDADKGCLQGFEDWVMENIIIVGGVGIGLAFVQVFGIIIACSLARTIHKETYQSV